jgi:hypothetical protein
MFLVGSSLWMFPRFNYKNMENKNKKIKKKENYPITCSMNYDDSRKYSASLGRVVDRLGPAAGWDGDW